jgi:hypothetical protein
VLLDHGEHMPWEKYMRLLVLVVKSVHLAPGMVISLCYRLQLKLEGAVLLLVTELLHSA